MKTGDFSFMYFFARLSPQSTVLLKETTLLIQRYINNILKTDDFFPKNHKNYHCTIGRIYEVDPTAKQIDFKFKHSINWPLVIRKQNAQTLFDLNSRPFAIRSRSQNQNYLFNLFFKCPEATEFQHKYFAYRKSQLPFFHIHVGNWYGQNHQWLNPSDWNKINQICYEKLNGKMNFDCLIERTATHGQAQDLPDCTDSEWATQSSLTALQKTNQVSQPEPQELPMSSSKQEPMPLSAKQKKLFTMFGKTTKP